MSADEMRSLAVSLSKRHAKRAGIRALKARYTNDEIAQRFGFRPR